MKLFDRLSDIERHVGCSIIIPDWYVGDHWLIFESDEPYTYRFVDYSADIDIHKNSDYSKDWLVLNPNTFYKTMQSNINMEQYIASYKHLIGCDFKHINQKGEYIKNADLGLWNIDKCFVSVQDNDNYIYQLKNIKLYLDDETLGTYEEYMQLHYPEYSHVWKHQL